VNGRKEDEPKPEIQIKEWTSDEQKLLEQALKTYSSADPERWAHIAACIPGRNRKDCMTRFKVIHGFKSRKYLYLHLSANVDGNYVVAVSNLIAQIQDRPYFY